MTSQALLANLPSLRSDERAWGSYACYSCRPYCTERCDQGQDVLLFIDESIFRFSQAGSEVSALLGRMPSAVGYQPLAEMGELQERIATRRTVLPYRQFTSLPDDLTDPALLQPLRLDCSFTVLSRAITESWYLPSS